MDPTPSRHWPAEAPACGRPIPQKTCLPRGDDTGNPPLSSQRQHGGAPIERLSGVSMGPAVGALGCRRAFFLGGDMALHGPSWGKRGPGAPQM